MRQTPVDAPAGPTDPEVREGVVAADGLGAGHAREQLDALLREVEHHAINGEHEASGRRAACTLNVLSPLQAAVIRREGSIEDLSIVVITSAMLVTNVILDRQPGQPRDVVLATALGQCAQVVADQWIEGLHPTAESVVTPMVAGWRLLSPFAAPGQGASDSQFFAAMSAIESTMNVQRELVRIGEDLPNSAAGVRCTSAILSAADDIARHSQSCFGTQTSVPLWQGAVRSAGQLLVSVLRATPAGRGALDVALSRFAKETERTVQALTTCASDLQRSFSNVGPIPAPPRAKSRHGMGM